MNRHFLIVILLTAMGAGLAAIAQETNAGPALDWSSFESIAQKNIFDPTRSGSYSRTGRVRTAPVVRTFVFNGTSDDTAWFTGSGAPTMGFLKVGGMINGYKVMKIPVSYTDAIVILTDPAGAIVILKQGDSMRREDEGLWQKSEQPAPLVISSPETPTDLPSASAGSSGTSSPASGSVSDMLEKLKQRHKQEE